MSSPCISSDHTHALGLERNDPKLTRLYEQASSPPGEELSISGGKGWDSRIAPERLSRPARSHFYDVPQTSILSVNRDRGDFNERERTLCAAACL
jgi:hypothetical protein